MDSQPGKEGCLRSVSQKGSFNGASVQMSPSTSSFLCIKWPVGSFIGGDRKPSGHRGAANERLIQVTLTKAGCHGNGGSKW